ncbi:alpha/beta hydrolase [Streptomyces sp. NPDC048297]|uniref:alpha/beta hydrolase n=1 Tax=Streptomyces sp. NPDC048297 TaxID=3365531 RepID=UPI00371D60DA
MATSLLSALALVCGVTATASAAPAPADTTTPTPATSGQVPRVVWTPCNPDPSKPDPGIYDCAVYPVPLDYANPSGQKIGIAMMRRRAGDPSERIGSLFINPGGPGGSGYLWATTNRLEPRVLDHFDLIGFDPRGVARSNPLQCFKTQEDATAVLSRKTLVPVTPAEVNSTLTADKDYTDACAANAGALAKHMSTMNVARDLDRMRQGVGDAQLSFVAFSYGTLIGDTYANMFPDKVRALVIDGNVDPYLRTHDGLEYDRQRAAGFELALDEFLKRCEAAGTSRCAFAEGDTRARFDAIRDHLRTSPVTLPSGAQVTLSSFTGQVAGALYVQAQLAPLARSLQALDQVINPQPALRTLAGTVPSDDADLLAEIAPTALRDTLGDSPYTTDDSYFGVNCQDKPYPTNPRTFANLAGTWEQNAPTFGRYQIFDSPPCATWPFPARAGEGYAGPWNRKTANPVLAVSNLFDPATPRVYALNLQQELGNVVLVTVDMIEHCAVGQNQALNAMVTSYLVDQKVPKPGQVLTSDLDPFPAPTS